LPEDAAAVFGVDVGEVPFAVVLDAAEGFDAEAFEFSDGLLEVMDFDGDVMKAGALLFKEPLNEALGASGGDDFEFDAGAGNLADAAEEAGASFAEVIEELEAEEALEEGGLILPGCGTHADVIDTLERNQWRLRGLVGGICMVRFAAMNSQSDARVRRAVIIANMAARGVRRRFDGEGALRFLRARGFTVELVVPGSAAEARMAARAAAEAGAEVVFAVGGDGSLRDVAAGVAGTKTALAAIPAGTANVFATEVGIPHGIRAAFAAHVEGQVVRMDLGWANDEPFLLMAGVGWDAAIARRIRPGLKRRLGAAAYVIQGLEALPSLHTEAVHWTSGQVSGDAPLSVLVLSNTRLYGGVVQFTPGADARDGLLDLCALSPVGRGDGTRLALKLLFGRLQGDRRVLDGLVRDLEIPTAGIPYQLDGDAVGETPVRFRVERGGLLVSVPAGDLPAVLRGGASGD
jgi:diacylglycerol kinase (ATP)